MLTSCLRTLERARVATASRSETPQRGGGQTRPSALTQTESSAPGGGGGADIMLTAR